MLTRNALGNSRFAFHYGCGLAERISETETENSVVEQLIVEQLGNEGWSSEEIEKILQFNKKVGKKIRISELKLGMKTRVETPTDAYNVLTNEFQRDLYIAEYGDIEVVFSHGAYRVPEFQEEKQRYIEKKAKDCEKWGCE